MYMWQQSHEDMNMIQTIMQIPAMEETRSPNIQNALHQQHIHTLSPTPPDSTGVSLWLGVDSLERSNTGQSQSWQGLQSGLFGMEQMEQLHQQPQLHYLQHQSNTLEMQMEEENDSYDRPAITTHAQNMPYSTGPSSIGHSTTKIAKKACVHCRQRKAACEDQRPCRRCKKAGRMCVDSDTSVVRGKRRLEEEEPREQQPQPVPPGPVMSAPASSTAMPSIPSGVVDPDASRRYSKSFLDVLLQSGTRDAILKMHCELQTLPLHLPSLLEFHRQCAMLCLNLDNQMLPDDMHSFITSGLSPAQVASPTWLSSPLASWASLATRPFYMAIIPLAATHPDWNADLSNSSKVDSSHGAAELRVEWDPAANTSFRNWQRALVAKIIYERQVQEARRLKSTGGLSSVAAVPSSTPSIDSVGDREDLFSNLLLERFSMLDVSTALQAPPPPPNACAPEFLPDLQERSMEVFHANWCPEFETSSSTYSANGVDTKVTRVDGMHSVHGQAIPNPATSSFPGLSSPCVCSLASALPVRVYTNGAFEHWFQWKRIDVENGMSRESYRWVSRFYLELAWITEQTMQIQHWKQQIAFVGRQAIAAARALIDQRDSPRPTSSESKDPQPTPEPWRPQFERIRSSRGELLPTVFMKSVFVEALDGPRGRSAVVVRWSNPHAEDAMETKGALTR